MTNTPRPTSLVRLDAVSRSFEAIRAVDGVSFDLRAGEVHGLCGHNGAGKSTIVKMLTGQLRPDSGRILIEGEPTDLDSPQAAQRRRIAFVDQELSVVPVLSVSDNVLLGGIGEPFWRRERVAQARAQKLLDQVGLDSVGPGDRVADLALGQRQQVEIARALGRDARLLILDEPTATLSSSEIEHVFAAIRRVTAAGCGVVYVSHRLDEVMEICDRITVLRDGSLVDTVERSALHTEALVSMMLGEAHMPATRSEATDSERGAELRIERLETDALEAGFNLRARAGRVLALAGQVGSGTNEVLRALAGLRPDAKGWITVDGDPLPLGSVHQTAAVGVAYVSNDRKGEGLFLGQPVGQNLLATRLHALSRAGVISRARMRRESAALAQAIGLGPERATDPVEKLSGGNQQKVLIGRCLHRGDTRVLLLDDPTRGVDVRGRAEIHTLIRAAAADGAIVVFTSTELEEILDLADEVTVMRTGRIVSKHDRSELDAHVLLRAMTHGSAQVAA